MKKKTVKGQVLFPVIAGVLIFVGGAAVGAGAMYLYGRMHGGGLGDSIEAGINLNPEEIPVIETIAVTEPVTQPETETTEPTTEPFTEPVTEAFSAMTVAIYENSYYYNGTPTDLEKLSAMFERMEEPDLTVRIIKADASRNAVANLKKMLQNQKILYIEETQSMTIESTEPVTEFRFD